MKILFLSLWFPYPVNNGSKLRIYNLLRGLTQHHEVTLLSFSDQPDINTETPEIREICSDVKAILWKEFNPKTLKAYLGIFSLKPRSVIDTFSPEMASAITETLDKQHYDLVIASQLQMAAYFPYFQNTPALFEEMEIGLPYNNVFSPNGKIRIRPALTWFKLRIYLSQLLNSFDAHIVVSDQERQLFVSNFPRHKEKVVVVPNCIDLNSYQGLGVTPEPNLLIFSGPFHYRVNYDAMQWFIREVYPVILDQIPETRLVITGDHEDLPLPPAPNIILTGYVDDIKPLVASSWVSLAPLLSGGGTRLKILEAMALGTPVVSTSKGVEGLGAISGKHLLIADSADIFANQVTKILKDKDLHDQLSNNGKRFVRENYNWKSTLPRFLSLVKNTVDGYKL